VKNKIIELVYQLPDSDLEKLYWSVEFLHQNYLYRKSLQDKGIILTERFGLETQQIVEQWDAAFAGEISDKTKEEIYFSEFKWHMFSYKKKDCLTAEAAREAFDGAAKDEVYVFYQNSPQVWVYTNAAGLRSTDFDSQQDVYVFDKALKWTYIHTHESYCGPYFCETVVE